MISGIEEKSEMSTSGTGLEITTINKGFEKKIIKEQLAQSTNVNGKTKVISANKS